MEKALKLTSSLISEIVNYGHLYQKKEAWKALELG
jgi:hypothetical protein